MALQEAETVELTEEFLIEEAEDALSVAPEADAADGIKRRLDRQLGLLKALPEGWVVQRRKLSPEGIGVQFAVMDGARVRGTADRAGVYRRQPKVGWFASGAHASAGDAWAHGIATLFAAIDAEAQIDAPSREVH